MSKKIIKTDNAPLPIGSYSQGLVIDGFIFTSGQVPIDPEIGQLIDGSFKEQIEQVFDNLENILMAGGSNLKNVVKFTVFLTDMDRYAEVNEVFNSRIKEGVFPARSLVAVSGLPAGAEIEIECIATLNE